MRGVVSEHWTSSPYPRLRLRRFEGGACASLKALNLEKALPTFWDDSERHHEEPCFTFDSLRRVFPTFPWRLTATTFFHPSASRRMWVNEWFHHPLENFVVDKYQELLANYSRDGAEEEADRPLGMVFPLHVRGGLIIHNGPRQNRGPLFGNHYIIGDQVFECWIERFDFWIEAVARSGWTPNTPFVPPQERLITLDARPGAWVEPWMMVCCKGVGPDSMVLAWLCRILLSDPTPPYEFDFLDRHEGERCVDATHEQIAAELPPLSSRQVKEALAHLRKRGLVTTDQTRIRLVDDAIKKAQQRCDMR